MIKALQPYAKYKESGQAWLGTVPQHWPVLPNRAMFSEVKQRECPDEEMLSVTITQGVIRQKTLLTNSSKKDGSNEDKSAYKLVCPNDLAYNKMRAWQGAIGISEFRGIVSPAYVVMRLRDASIPRYFHHLYRTPQFAKEAERWSYGITSDMWSLRPEHFKMIYTPEPPPNEQAAIVRFIEWSNARLERAIRIKEKIVLLLEEEKRSVVHQLLREISGPRYSVGRLIQKRWLEIQDGNHGELHPKASDYVEDGIPFLMANDVRPNGINVSTCAKITESQARSLRIGFAIPGDILLTHKATIGQVGRVPSDLTFPFVMLTPQVTYYRSLTTAIDAGYLLFFMQSPEFQQQLRVLSLNQSTRP